MLKREYRFQGLGSVRPAMRHGATQRADLFALKCLPNSKRVASRVSIIVSNKVSKSAVVRNRIRRRLYAQFETNWHQVASAFDIVVIAYDARLATIDAAELERIFKNTLRRAHLMD